MPKQVSLRFPTGLWTRARTLLPHLRRQSAYQGVHLTTSRVLVISIARGLEQLEAELGLGDSIHD